MLTPDEAVKIPLVLDLPPAPPPKFKVIRRRTPIQGCPWIVCQVVRKFGTFFVPHMDAQPWHVWKYKKKDIETYIPMTVVKKEINGKKKLVHQPLLPNLIFAYMTYEQSLEFVKEPARTASYIKYYTDKTKPIVEETGLNPPMIIPDNEMKNFINATSVPSEHSGMIPKERVHYKSGELVRVIKGDFTGVIGRVARASGQQRIAIDVDGLGTFVTAYIPNDFIQEWPSEDNF